MQQLEQTHSRRVDLHKWTVRGEQASPRLKDQYKRYVHGEQARPRLKDRHERAVHRKAGSSSAEGSTRANCAVTEVGSLQSVSLLPGPPSSALYTNMR